MMEAFPRLERKKFASELRCKMASQKPLCLHSKRNNKECASARPIIGD
jgi:hypothetical protein